MAIHATSSDPLTQAFSEHLAEQVGWGFAHARWPELRRGLEALAREAGPGNAQSLMRAWLRAPLRREQVESLARHLAIGESYFFREPAALELLQEEVLRPLIARRRAEGRRWLRLWSAGCSTGEEIYTLAMLLERLLPDLAQWDLLLLGTDIHPGFLARAAQGEYREWSFRNAPAWIRPRHFEPLPEGLHAVRPELKQRVRFAYANLADELPPELASMDLVLCRNVLMYFERRQAVRAMQRLRGAMADDGWLLLGASEAGAVDTAGFAATRVQGHTFLRKTGDMPEPLAQPPAAIAATGTAPMTPAAQAACFADRARRHADEGRLDAAQHWCEAALEADLHNADLHYLQAVIHEECGRLDDTRSALQRVLSLDPAFVLAHFTLGRLCQQQGLRHDAQHHFVRALALLEDEPACTVLPGSGGMSAGLLSEAIRNSLQQP